MKAVIIASKVYRLVQAQDPEEEEVVNEGGNDETGAELVKELREGPAEKWRKFLQPILINIRNKFGLEVGQVKLLNPKMRNKFTSPSYGFAIVGHVKFLPEIPGEVRERYGLPPYKFEAIITPAGDLVSSVRIIGSEG